MFNILTDAVQDMFPDESSVAIITYTSNWLKQTPTRQSYKCTYY